MVRGKSQCSVLDIGTAQLTVLKVRFHLEVETGFVTSPKMFNYRHKGVQLQVKLPLLMPLQQRPSWTGLGVVV